MKEIKYLDHCIQIDPPTKTKKITGTRFAAIFNSNPWTTEFEVWCAITKTYEKPFEDNIYTRAGKIIEPKQAEYVKKFYGMDLISPSDMYGTDYFKKTRGDFFPSNKYFGGMWDYLAKDENGNISAVLEMKTTKRAEDWQGDIPEYYAQQAALYAYLLGVDEVIMVATFLEEKDYQNIEEFKPNANNTILIKFKLSQRYPYFADLIEGAKTWWDLYVTSGLSPRYDEKKDAEILKALRTNIIEDSHIDLKLAIDEAEQLKQELEEVEKSIKPKQNRLEVLTKIIKNHAINSLRQGDNKVIIKGQTYVFTLSKSSPKPKIIYDDEAMILDNVYSKYTKLQESESSFRFTIKNIEV